MEFSRPDHFGGIRAIGDYSIVDERELAPAKVPSRKMGTLAGWAS